MGLGGRQPAARSCRDEVLDALHELSTGNGKQVFTVREVYAEMVARGTAYAEATVFKTMKRMNASSARPRRWRRFPTGNGTNVTPLQSNRS